MKKVNDFIQQLADNERNHLSQISDIRDAVKIEIRNNKNDENYCERLFKILDVFNGTFSSNVTNSNTQNQDEKLLEMVNKLTVHILK